MSFVFAGRYECISVLGRGGFGVVWLSNDHHLGRQVALKLFQAGAPFVLAVQEARILTALESPCILRVFNADRYQDVPYLATEVAAGGSTWDRSKGLGVRPDLAIRWIRHMLVGLSVCHGQGLLHRDIKPSNIFLKTDDSAQLGDFGVAWLLDSSGQAPVHGTLEICAPEGFKSGLLTVVSDVYSAGVSLYALLTGALPFTGSNPAEVRGAVLARRHPRLRDVAPHVPLTLASRVERAMSEDPSARYPSPEAFHNALGELRQFRRLWNRTTPHIGHFACWQSEPTRSASGIQVCVVSSGSGYQVESRHTAGARNRLIAGCAASLRESQLWVFLRRVFDHL